MDPSMDTNKMSQDISGSSIKLCENKLRSQLQMLQEQNAKLDRILEWFGLMGFDKNSSHHPAKEASTINKEIDKLNEPSPDLEDISKSVKQRKRSNYVAKLKICMKIYTNLNEKLSNDLKILKGQLHHSKNRMQCLQTTSSEEVQLLEAKIKRYDNELKKFEKKYPWLKDPEFDLPNIMAEIMKLNKLREEKTGLLEELDAFHGLKPDIGEANQQLSKIKSEYELLIKGSGIN